MKLNLFQRIIHRIKRKLFKLKISAELDKNQKFDIDLSKLPEHVRNAITILKHVLASEKCHIHYGKHGNIIVSNEKYRIYVEDTKNTVCNLYIQNGITYIVHINELTLLYTRWLIDRRSYVNFNKHYSEIMNSYEGQIKNTLNGI